MSPWAAMASDRGSTLWIWGCNSSGLDLRHHLLPQAAKSRGSPGHTHSPQGATGQYQPFHQDLNQLDFGFGAAHHANTDYSAIRGGNFQVQGGEVATGHVQHDIYGAGNTSPGQGFPQIAVLVVGDNIGTE